MPGCIVVGVQELSDYFTGGEVAGHDEEAGVGLTSLAAYEQVHPARARATLYQVELVGRGRVLGLEAVVVRHHRVAGARWCALRKGQRTRAQEQAQSC